MADDNDFFDPSEFGGTVVARAKALDDAAPDDDYFDPSEFGAKVVQAAPSVSAGKTPSYDPDAPVAVPPQNQADEFDPSEFGGRIVDSKYKNVAAGPRVYTNSLREDMLSRWQTTYSKMPEGPERERYGKLLSKAWDSHVDMQRYNDPLLFRAATSGMVTGGVGLMKGGLALGEIALDIPGVNSIPGADGAKQSLAGARETLETQQQKYEAIETEFDKEAWLGETKAGLARDMSGLATQLLMAYAVPGGGAKVGTVPLTRSSVKLSEVALGTLLGSEAAANSLAKHPDDPKTALLHGIVNGAGAVFLGKSGDLAAKFGGKLVPRAVKAVSDKFNLTPIFATLAHSQGAGAEMAATAATDYMMDVALTKDTFDSDELVRRMEGAYAGGAVMGGTMGAFTSIAQFLKQKSALKELAAALKQRGIDAPIAAQAIKDARAEYHKGVATKNEADIEAGVTAKAKEREAQPAGYDEYFNKELETLQTLENEYRDQYKSLSYEREQIKTRREETQAKLEELSTRPQMQDIQSMRDSLIAEMKGLDQREFAVNQRLHSMDRNGKSVKDFVESELDRLSNEDAYMTEQSATDRFSKDLDDAMELENEIATKGRTQPEPPIPGQESGNVPVRATEVEMADSLGHFTVSGRHRDINKMRTFFDIDKMTPEQSKGFEETMIRAEQRGLINQADQIALDAIESESKHLPDEEFVAVIERGRQNKDKYIDLLKQHNEAKTPEQRHDANTAMKALEDQQRLLTEAAYRGNTAAGRRLNLAKLTLEQAYDPSALISKGERAIASRGESAGSRELTALEREKLLGIASRIQDNAKIKADNPDITSPEFRKADYQEYLGKVDADRYIASLRPRSLAGRVVSGATFGLQDIMKSMKLTMDVSILAMHGGIPAMTRPTILFSGVAKGFKTVFNSEELLAAHRQMQARPNYDLYQKFDIGLRDVTDPIGKHEYIFLREVSGRIPGISNMNNGNLVALNEIRANLFDALVKARGRDNITHEGMQSIASYVRTATGDGGLGSFEPAAKALGGVFLAPRWFVSRFQHVLGGPGNIIRAYRSGDKATAALIGREYAKQYLATSTAAYIAANVAALAYPGKVTYTMNPANPNFGLMTINGTDYDITSGLRKPVRLVSSMIRSATGHDKPMDTIQTVGGLFTNALGPGGRIINEVLMRKETGSGRKIDLSDPNQVAWFMGKQIIPLPVESFIRGLRDEGMSARAAQETAASVMGIPAWKHKAKSR